MDVNVFQYKLKNFLIEYRRPFLDWIGWGHARTSTANRVRKVLLKKGISTEEIRGEHLVEVYKKCNRLPTGSRRPVSPLRGRDLEGGSNEESREPLWGLIVETRPHPALEFVISTFSENLDIPIQFFCSPASEQFILSTKVRSLIADGRVVLSRSCPDPFPASAYNSLFLTEAFWRQVRGQYKILVFQSDSLLCKNSDYSIHDFLKYDYIGTNLSRVRRVGLIIDGGGGGLSLRDKPKTLECLSRFPPDAWQAGEDGYFAFHMDLMGCAVGRLDECAMFATQGSFKYRSFGVHAPWLLPRKQLRRFVQYCPEARNLFVGKFAPEWPLPSHR